MWILSNGGARRMTPAEAAMAVAQDRARLAWTPHRRRQRLAELNRATKVVAQRNRWWT